jgi:hypothetical protein
MAERIRITNRKDQVTVKQPGVYLAGEDPREPGVSVKYAVLEGPPGVPGPPGASDLDIPDMTLFFENGLI